MENNNSITENGQAKQRRQKHCIAFHEAGHAAGIHFNNPQKRLPSVFFNIVMDTQGTAESGEMAYQDSHDNCIARVEGGRLIESFPPSMAILLSERLGQENGNDQVLEDYQRAFDTDIVNLLIGPLAEAKYVIAERDNEPFNSDLVKLQALENYGGGSDLVVVDEYMQSLAINQEQKAEKLTALFAIAFNFVSNELNWAAITKLANYILGSKKPMLGCEEIIDVLEQSAEHFQTRRKLAFAN